MARIPLAIVNASLVLESFCIGAHFINSSINNFRIGWYQLSSQAQLNWIDYWFIFLCKFIISVICLFCLEDRVRKRYQFIITGETSEFGKNINFNLKKYGYANRVKIKICFREKECNFRIWTFVNQFSHGKFHDKMILYLLWCLEYTVLLLLLT